MAVASRSTPSLVPDFTSPVPRPSHTSSNGGFSRKTAAADISVNGGPTFHVNFASTFSWNQFWNLTIPVRLRRGANTIKFIANQQYNYDGKTIGVIYSGSDIGEALRSSTAPNIDQVTLAPLQLGQG